MLNAIQKIFKRGKQSQPQKNWGTSTHLYPLGFSTNDSDIQYSKQGAAASFAFVPEVNNSISSIVSAVSLLEWNIVKYPLGLRRENGRVVDGEVLASSSDLQKRHPFQRALTKFQTDNGFSLLSTIALDYTLYGEIVLEVATNQFDSNPVIEWLNPLGVSVFATNEIEWFQYGWNQSFVRILPSDVAYIHNRNTFNDFVGYPQVLAVLDEVNIKRNLNRFLRDYFLNNARPGMVLSPSTPEGDLSDPDYANLKKAIRDSLQGVGNQYNTLIAQKSLNVQAFEQPDISRNVSLSEEQANAIYELFGVPRAMRGNTNITPYKDGDETTQRFYLNTVLPFATKVLQSFINAELMPYFDDTNGQVVFEFDTSAFDRVTQADLLEAQVVDVNLNNGIITMWDAARIQEQTLHDEMKDLVLIQGVPVPLSELRTYWEKQLLVSPSPYNAQEVTGEPLPEPAQPEDVIPTIEGGEPVSDEFIEEAIDNGVTRSHKHHDHTHLSALFNGDPSEGEIEARVSDSLKSYQKYALRRWGKKSIDGFKSDILPAYIHYAIIDALDESTTHDDVIDVFKTIFDNPRVKSITTYQRAIREFARGLWSGDIDRRQFESDLDRRIDNSFNEAFARGLDRGGLALADLTASEANELATLISNEQGFIPALADYIEANSRSEGGSLSKIIGRVNGWVPRYNQVENLGFIVASRNKKILWKYDPRKEHCLSCKKLNGQVRRASFWKRINLQPQSPRLECFGTYCGCEFIETDKPVTKGRMPNLRLRG